MKFSVFSPMPTQTMRSFGLRSVLPDSHLWESGAFETLLSLSRFPMARPPSSDCEGHFRQIQDFRWSGEKTIDNEGLMAFGERLMCSAAF